VGVRGLGVGLALCCAAWHLSNCGNWTLLVVRCCCACRWACKRPLLACLPTRKPRQFVLTVSWHIVVGSVMAQGYVQYLCMCFSEHAGRLCNRDVFRPPCKRRATQHSLTTNDAHWLLPSLQLVQQSRSHTASNTLQFTLQAQQRVLSGAAVAEHASDAQVQAAS
jgi:hypothetical protein